MNNVEWENVLEAQELDQWDYVAKTPDNIDPFGTNAEGKYVDNNTVSVNISRLRTKIEKDASKPELIKTIHGIGYIWREF